MIYVLCLKITLQCFLDPKVMSTLAVSTYVHVAIIIASSRMTIQRLKNFPRARVELNCSSAMTSDPKLRSKDFKPWPVSSSSSSCSSSFPLTSPLPSYSLAGLPLWPLAQSYPHFLPLLHFFLRVLRDLQEQIKYSPVGPLLLHPK